MIELELLGVNDDTIVMTNADGERYTLLIDDALRAAVRRERGAVEAVAPEPGTPVRPRDLQALMRAGATAEEVAASTGMPLDHVRKYQGPVTAERNWTVTQARACTIGHEKDSPVLGDLVVDRLATRGVDATYVDWDATRNGREPWQVTVTFIQGAKEKQACWEFNLSSRSLTALDDEARWLTETSTPARRSSVFDQDSSANRAFAVAGDNTATAAIAQQQQVASAPDVVEPSSTDALLADLADARGQRVEMESFEDTEAAGIPAVEMPASEDDAQVVSMSARRRQRVGNHPAGSQLPENSGASAASAASTSSAKSAASAQTATDGIAQVDSVQSPADDVTPAQGVVTQDALLDLPGASKPKARKRSRRSVPSWDEIVFGSKSE